MSCHDTSAQRVRKQKHTQTSSQIILLRRKANKNKWRMFHCKLCASYSRCPVPKGNRYPTVGAPPMANRYPMCVASSRLQLHFSSPSNQQCYHLLWSHLITTQYQKSNLRGAKTEHETWFATHFFHVFSHPWMRDKACRVKTRIKSPKQIWNYCIYMRHLTVDCKQQDKFENKYLSCIYI